MLYFQNPGQSSEFVIDGSDPELFRSLENDLGDSLSIASEIDHIRMGARVRAVSDSGDVLFIGSVVSIEYSAVGGQRRYDCIAAEALLQCRYAPEIIYPGGVGLTLSDIFSSDAPPQGAGATQYCMGLLWLSRSKICDGQDTGIVSWDSDGVGTLEGWGPLVTGHDIYYGGHLLAESTLSAITGGTYRYAISGGNLYIRGAGAGAIYDVIAADGWTENHVRLGTVATDSEVEAPYEVGETDVWSLIRDLVSETGQYVVFRREEDYVYLDISATPKARGSESAPHASLHIGDDFSLQKISPPRYIPYSCVVGMGAGAENIEGVRYARGELLCPGQAWLETTYQLPDARLPPWGHLDQATDDFYDAIHQHAPVEIDLYRGGMDVGDWIELDLEGGEKFAAQIRSIRETIAGEVAVVGAPDLSLLTAFLERSETGAIEAYRDRLVGEASDSSESNMFAHIYSTGEKTIASIGVFQNDDIAIAGTGDGGSGAGGKIFRSTDRGVTWAVAKNVTPEHNITSIATWENGYAIAGSSPNGKIFRSTDYGATWTEVYDSSGSQIWAMSTWENGYAIAGTSANGRILRSTDYGETWAEVYNTSEQYIFGTCAIPTGHGFAGTYPSGKIFRSTDYGATWTEVYDSSESFIYSLAGWTSGIILAGSSSGGKIFRSTDYGTTWTEVYDSPSKSIQKLHAFRNGFVVASSSAGELYRSTNWGKDWEDVSGLITTSVSCITSWEDGLMLSGHNTIGTASGHIYISGYEFEMNFTPDDFGTDAGLVLFSLSSSGTTSQENPDAAVDCIVTVNGARCAYLTAKPIYGNIISDLDISQFCRLDGNLETISVLMIRRYAISQNSDITGTVRGITKP